MATIRIFNPDHDLALAANLKNFTAPHAGRKLRSDIGFFPVLWAEDGDIIIVDDIDFAESNYRKLRIERKPKVEFCTMQQLKAVVTEERQKDCEVKFDAWGWDKSLCFQLMSNGVGESLLPDANALETIRTLSNRRFSSSVLAELCGKFGGGTCGESIYVTDIEEFNVEILKKDNRCVVKAPWSCSGRGVRYLLGEDDMEATSQNTHNWVRNVLQQQGGIMMEPYYNKVKDFAVEFKLENNGKVSPLGYSVFDTKNGAYTGNLLATEEEKRSILSQYIDISLLDDVVDEICSIMAERLSSLVSLPVDTFFGVDMMICAKPDADGFLLHPCVEINLRRTMGLASLYLTPARKDNKAVMSITYESKKYHLNVKKLNQ